MKFIKQNVFNKIIIMLVIILLFNAVCPDIVHAVDLGGILLQPFYWFALAIIIPVEMVIGATIQLENFDIDDDTDKILSTKVDKEGNGYDSADDIRFADLFIGPDTIFSGQIKSFNANIFNYADGGDTDILTNVTKAVASFYVILRNICAVVMLMGLIFTGIRILISSNIPSMKTQYLMLLQDWVIGMALLIFSHIIMILVFELSDALTLVLKNSLSAGSLKWTILKMLGGSFDSSTQIIALTLYAIIGVQTIIFAIAYFKRFFWTCILVVFAPLFSVMYAFGQQTKQIYGKWLREFITNAFVQPFHMIVYTVLVILPLRIAHGGGTWTWSWDLGSEMIYCLMGIAMIKPAEKWLRSMFGLDQGIANMASYDSGQKTIISAVKAVATVVASVFTGGAAAAAVKSAAALKGAAAASKAKDAMTKIGQATNNGGMSSLPADGGQQAMLDTYDEKFGTSEWDSHEREQLAQGTGDDQSYMEQWTPQDYVTNAYGDDFSQALNEAGGADALREELAGTGMFDDNQVADFMNAIDPSDNGMAEKIAEGVEEGNEESLEDKEQAKGIGDGNYGMSADNVTITAGNVNMQGNQSLDSIKTIDAGEVNAEEQNAEEQEENKELDNGEGLELEEGKPGFLDKLRDYGESGKMTRDLGFANELYKAKNSVADTLYVTPPSGNWKEASGFMDSKLKEASDKKKERDDRNKDVWANNKGNIQIMADKYYGKELEKAKDKYSDPNGQYSDKDGNRYTKNIGYIEGEAREKAENKAKGALKDMSAFVPYGITDVNLAYELYQDCNNYGLKPEQAITKRAGFESFNSNVENIANINVNPVYEGNNYQKVSEAIPNAQEYYNAGYKNINDMAWVDYMAERLSKSPAYAINLDQALKKKGGKINYSGSNEEMKNVVKQINDHYNNG